MPVLPRALEIQGEIAAVRRDIHAHPELAYEENRTSDMVAAKLQKWGLEVTRGLGRTGLVRPAAVRAELAAAMPEFAGLEEKPRTGKRLELATVS